MVKNGGNMLREFLDTHGITQNWVVLRIDVPQASFFYYLNNGFTPEVADRLTTAIREIGDRLAKFKLTSNNVADFDFLKSECGIQHKYFWQFTGCRMASSLGWKLRKGLSPDEKTAIMAAIKQTAIACKKFKLPAEIVRRAA